jgi:pimeloyl-ACP methyl ester carboxylesterase
MLRSVRLTSLPLALLLLIACDDGPPIRQLEGATPVRQGALTLTPIEFATTDFYVRPSRTRAEEGRLSVPESRRRSAGRTLELRFVRFAATSGSKGSPIIYLAGGPGASGIWSASGDRNGLFMKLRGAGDVIALDQRGAGLSRPAPVCPGSWSYPLDRPHNDDTLAALLAPYLRECAAAFGDSLDVAAFNTAESADDLEDLRIALGADRLRLVGMSYGTHLALAYLRRYPDRVERAVLAGVEGPDHTWKLPANIDAILQRIDSAIAADARAHRAIPDFLGSLRATLAQLDADPVTLDATHPRTKEQLRVTVGGDDLRRAVLNVIAERERIERMLQRLLPILQGDYTALAQRAALTRLDNDERVMTLSMDCSSGATRERLALIDSQAADAVLRDVANGYLRAQCATWPYDDLGDGFRAPIHSPVPTLFISGTLDPRTPPATAEEVARGFPNGRHLVIEGAAHDDDLLISSPRIGDLMLRFLSGEDVGHQRVRLAPLRFELP